MTNSNSYKYVCRMAVSCIDCPQILKDSKYRQNQDNAFNRVIELIDLLKNDRTNNHSINLIELIGSLSDYPEFEPFRQMNVTSPPTVYRYIKENHAVETIEENTIRFTNADSFPDRTDCSGKDLLKYKRVARKLLNEMKQQTSNVKTGEYLDDLIRIINRENTNLRESLNVCCTSLSPDEPRLWSEPEKKQVLLELDTSRIDITLHKVIYLEEINYDEVLVRFLKRFLDHPNISTESIRNEMFALLCLLFYRKNPGYGYENECRGIINRKFRDEERNHPMGEGAIRSVTVDDSINDEVYDRILEICKKRNIPVFHRIKKNCGTKYDV